jgi:hypothetical protein
MYGLAISLLLLVPGTHGQMAGSGMGGGMMGGGEGGGNSEEMVIIGYLFDHHTEIDRTVSQDSNGVIHSNTRSDTVQVSDWIKLHVSQMVDLVEQNLVIRPWDPVFAALFQHSNEVITTVSETSDGVAVSEEGLTECGKSLAELHSEVVSKFVSLGMEEAMNTHQVPEGVCTSTRPVVAVSSSPSIAKSSPVLFPSSQTSAPRPTTTDVPTPSSTLEPATTSSSTEAPGARTEDVAPATPTATGGGVVSGASIPTPPSAVPSAENDPSLLLVASSGNSPSSSAVGVHDSATSSLSSALLICWMMLACLS